MNQIKHILHPEEEILFGNFQHGHDTLVEVYNTLTGISSDIDITYKMDGSPAIVFGYHPINKKFFVGTKSVFNLKPKINYSLEDITKNHGTNAKLTKILKMCFELLSSTITNNAGIYQGDILYIEDDKKYYDDYITFNSNTITYQSVIHQKDYEEIEESMLGIAVHTKYYGEADNEFTLTGLLSKPGNRFELKHVPEVYIHDLYVDVSKALPAKNKLSLIFLERAQLQFNTLSAVEKELIVKHGQFLKMFYNHNIKNDKYTFTDGGPSDYYVFLEKHLDDNISKYKTQKSIDKYTDIKNNYLLEITDNVVMFMTLMLIYTNIVNAKNFLVSSLNTVPVGMNHYINDESTGPEGYVVCSKTGMSKLVYRHVFSKHNFITFQQKSNL